jgi:hypothetical protein
MKTDKKFNVTFILGLPDSKTVKVAGYNNKGQLLYMWNGNADFHAQVKGDNLVSNIVHLVWFDEPTRKFSKPDIIINCINDADIAGKSLETAKKMVELVKSKLPDVKIFNDPAKISETTREKIYQNYNNLAEIEIPKTIKTKPLSPQMVFDEAKKAGIKTPFLIRPCGAHQSEGLQKIEGESEIKKLEKYPFNGSEYYITQFEDYRNNQGLYKKCRLVIIGGVMLPRHYMTGEEWLVHGDLHEQYMATNDASKKDEAYYMMNYKKMISRKALDSLMEIYHKSGLDYLGFDFAIKEDKSLLIFEINPAQNSFIKLDFKIFPYMKKTREDIIKALNQAVLAKLGK